ncbi:hypothetical protein DF268_08615 [Streptomyces sp. V2]|uniref:hypothetical protein n=1 Tax=Streptomyces sp. V2 TaxID=1424099 RepID=UPI000D66A66B|nr:hypothetical protein [Streptomyces sp. V2]PWG13918.1 hypothetical protein DF268_08615 [Streptomyces sp. V2]
MTGPSSSPRPEHTPRPGATWNTRLVRTETVVDDDTPDPTPPNRATRRAAARAMRHPIRQYPDELREQAEADDVPKPCLGRAESGARCALPQRHDGDHEPRRPDGQQIAGAIITTLQQRGYSLPAPDVHAVVDAILDLQETPVPMTDAEVRTALRPYVGRYGSPIACLHRTGEIDEYTRLALLNRAARLDADGLGHDADRLRDVAEYVLDAGCRPPVDGWTER